VNKAVEVICIIIIAVAGIIGLVLLRGLVLADLWQWFVTPLGAPRIGIAHAIGLSTILTTCMMGFATDKPDKDDESGPWAKVIKAFTRGLLYCLFAWGMGALVHGFM
jgi:hypothetical protein